MNYSLHELAQRKKSPASTLAAQQHIFLSKVRWMEYYTVEPRVQRELAAKHDYAHLLTTGCETRLLRLPEGNRRHHARYAPRSRSTSNLFNLTRVDSSAPLDVSFSQRSMCIYITVRETCLLMHR